MSWTLDELAERAARALTEADVRVANGRVTGVPDGRLIRWYATIGLVDRPLVGPGRSARYGPRHLLQLVAIKRLQAQGHPLVEIQQRLAGATEATLRRIANLPAAPGQPTAAPGPDVKGLEPGSSPLRAAPKGLEPGSSPNGPAKARFWAAVPDEPAEPVPSAAGPERRRDTVERVHGVRLGGLTLLLPAPPAADDLDAIAEAARPLLDLLAARGLLTRREGS
jgi:DNA-binding transcriptional MerR regulator